MSTYFVNLDVDWENEDEFSINEDNISEKMGILLNSSSAELIIHCGRKPLFDEN